MGGMLTVLSYLHLHLQPVVVIQMHCQPVMEEVVVPLWLVY